MDIQGIEAQILREDKIGLAHVLNALEGTNCVLAYLEYTKAELLLMVLSQNRNWRSLNNLATYKHFFHGN